MLIINPRRGTKGYVTVVVLSFVHSFVHSVHRATESSAHFFAPVKVRSEQAKHVDGLQSDSWILLKCFRSRVMAGSP